MCISPIRIKNTGFIPEHLRSIQHLNDTTSAYINVPCGHCVECLRSRQNKFIQRSYVQSLDYYLFMGMLSYNSESMPIVTIGSHSYQYADVTDFNKMIKRIRKLDFFSERDFKYLLVSEFGGHKHRPHFHFLFWLKKLDTDTDFTPFNLQSNLWSIFLSNWVRNYGSSRVPIYKPLLTYKHRGRLRNYDLQYVPNHGTSANLGCAYYVTKYTLKPDKDFVSSLYKSIELSFDDIEQNFDLVKFRFSCHDIKDLHSFSQIWNKVRPKIIPSKGLGFSSDLQKDFILDGIARHDIPTFVNPVNGSLSGLSKFYQDRFLTPADKLRFMDNSPDTFINLYDGFSITQDVSESRVNSNDVFFDNIDKIKNGNDLFLDL